MSRREVLDFTMRDLLVISRESRRQVRKQLDAQEEAKR